MSSYLERFLAGDAEPTLPEMLSGGVRVRSMGEGLVCVEPSQPRYDLLISSGIHGNETAPIELACGLLQAILDDRLVPQARILFALGNPEAIRQGVRYLDDDLNRLFGKDPAATGQGPAAVRARILESAVRQFFSERGERWRLHYDLHTAIRGSKIEKFAIYPFPHDDAFDEAEIARLGRCGIEAVLLQSKPSPTFSYFTRRHCGAHGFTLELGKARPFGQNQAVDLRLLAAELLALISGEPALDGVGVTPTLFSVSREVIKQSDAFVLHVADDVENFTELPQGMTLADDATGSFVVDEIDARIVFPNPKVKNGLRAGLVVVPTQLPTR
ncbi:MAG: succinylglutamate desuccinylase [Burkholderiales bacterium]|nr:succinylglutamate desuccinylase [Burkholderiales bacterium]